MLMLLSQEVLNDINAKKDLPEVNIHHTKMYYLKVLMIPRQVKLNCCIKVQNVTLMTLKIAFLIFPVNNFILKKRFSILKTIYSPYK